MMETRRNLPLVVYDVLESTNESILQAGEGGAPEGTTHIARRQTRGRGRAGHTWWSPADAGLWMSTLLRPRHARPHLGGLTLLAAAAAYDALRGLGVSQVRLYWPNDLFAAGRKLGGVLGEARGPRDRAWVALGIGINLDLSAPEARAAMPPELRGQATSVREAMDGDADWRPEPVEVGRRILDHFWPLYDRYQEGEPVPGLIGGRLAHAGGRVTVRAPGAGAGGGDERRGRLAGLAPDGELLVEDGEEVLHILAGDVVYEGET